MSLDLLVIGLSITSSWGNGHATTFRALLRELAARGHRVRFLERDVPWYAAHRDLPQPGYCAVDLYEDLDDLRRRFTPAVRAADAVLVGSYVPEGIAVGDWALEEARGTTAFYDLDTPVTLAALARGERIYLDPRQIPRYHLYCSFSGGPLLRRLEREYGSPCARPLYCGVDAQLYRPEAVLPGWDFGYLGTYSADRQPVLDRLLLEPARRQRGLRLVVAGAQYPAGLAWPANVERIEHVPPEAHRRFYNRQRFTLNATRSDMVRAGYSPSVRLFEAAACGVPVISDAWAGLEEFFQPGEEILVARDGDDSCRMLRDIDETRRRAIGERARARVLAEHTAAHRAASLESYLLAVRPRSGLRVAGSPVA